MAEHALFANSIDLYVNTVVQPMACFACEFVTEFTKCTKIALCTIAKYQ
jgi:hypothetical protein